MASFSFDETKLKQICLDLLVAALGGQQTFDMLISYHEEQFSSEELADMFKKSSHVQVLRELDVAANLICEVGCWPSHWKRRYRKPGERRQRTRIVDNLEKLHA